MATYREDPLTGAWLIEAPARAVRPHRTADPAARPTGCPFCPGNEGATPPEITRAPLEGAWQVRVFPNLYPAVGPGRDGRSLADGAPAVGAHEVIATTPQHDQAFADLDDAGAATALGMMLARVHALHAAGAAYAQAFINHGREAGASIDHPHAQVVSMNVVPPAVRAERTVLTDASCLLCDWSHEADRVIGDRPGAIALVPTASPWREAVIVAATEHGLGVDEAGTTSLAVLLRDVLRAIRERCADPAYNVVLHAGPAGASDGHLHLHVIPRLAKPGGFELGTGVDIVTAAPSEWAVDLRERLA